MKKLFGTDGVRGIANKELTCELAYKIGQAGAYVLTKGKDNAKIIIGKDTRISGDMLEAALVAGICSVGVDVECLGVIPTPAISYLTKKYKADAGVVISASHNPVEYNGIKFFSETGYKLSDKVELEIESYINGDKDKIELPFGDNVGVKKTNKQGLYDYENYIKNTIDIKLDGMKIALDCSEGAAYKCGPEVFESLGAEVYVIHNNPDGKNINKNCGSTHLEQIRKFTLANKCDIGLAFDGDADRCLAVDELGQDIDGDYIMTILANKLKNDGLLKNNTLVATVMSNMGLDIAMKELDIDVVKTQVGDKYVLEEMVAKGYKLGGEQSGHIIMLDYNTTGDGLLTAVKLAEAVKLSGQKFSQLKSTMKALPQILVNAEVPNDKKDIYLEDNEIKDMISRAEQTLDGKGRVLIRASGTEPLVRVMLEGENIEEITDMANEISELIYNKSN